MRSLDGQRVVAAQAVQILIRRRADAQSATALGADQIDSGTVDLHRAALCAAGAGNAAPGGDVTQLGEYLVHNNAVHKRLVLAILALLNGGLQIPQRSLHTVNVANIAAKLPFFRAGEANALAAQDLVCADLGTVFFTANAAGRGDPEGVPVRLSGQFAFTAISHHRHSRRIQSKFRPLTINAFAAGGANVSKGTLFLCHNYFLL